MNQSSRKGFILLWGRKEKVSSGPNWVSFCYVCVSERLHWQKMHTCRQWRCTASHTSRDKKAGFIYCKDLLGLKMWPTNQITNQHSPPPLLLSRVICCQWALAQRLGLVFYSSPVPFSFCIFCHAHRGNILCWTWPAELAPVRTVLCSELPCAPLK